MQVPVGVNRVCINLCCSSDKVEANYKMHLTNGDSTRLL